DWTDCNDTINAIYTQQHNDTGDVFDHIYSSGYPLRVLIYNGDIDTACNFLGDQWFVEAFAKRHGLATTKNYGEWDFESIIAGYWKRFAGGKLQVDLLTVKGAGHLVPTDRPGPSFQMINAFLNNVSYNSSSPLVVARTPLKPQYQIQAQIAQSVKVNQLRSRTADFVARRSGAKPDGESIAQEIPVPPRQQARYYPDSKLDDLITNLPGLTFQDGFQMYSGFLNATNGTHLHYWLVESERDPANDPIVLWLNGGPGCSSLVGLLTELGPFRPSADGSELLENPYSWNKFANVFFLEAPRAVGYSYNENDPDNIQQYNDDKTADDNAAAVINFFAKFPEYQNRPFYITGESYGGVYIPTLADRILAYVNGGNQNQINFQGVAIGNGILSEYDQLNSAVDLMYFRGIYDRENYEEVAKCCVNNDVWSARTCNFSIYDWQDSAPGYNDTFFKNCQNLVRYLGEELVDGTTNDAYNTYQDCYNGQAGLLQRTGRHAGPAKLLGPTPEEGTQPPQQARGL
uniref:Carboxypeptidase n=1 Tax=Steinernema glaseri TaxID=37863 RepID=A0A1I8A8H4_9BILA